MKHGIIAMIIALLSGASITILLIPALLSNRQLWLVFFISTSVIFFLIWVFNEFIIFRDLHKLKKLIKKLGENNEFVEDAGQSLKMLQSQDLAHDITDYYNRKNQHLEELIKNSNLRRQFIADVSHELKSPLFSAQGYVHTLLDGAVLDKEVRTKFLMKAAKNLDYLDVLIQDLLTLSQIETKAIRMFTDHFDMVALAHEVLEDRESKAAKAEITLSCSYEKSPLIVYADYTRIMQVLTNLVNNGINYNRKGGSVSINIEEKPEGIMVAVSDDGEGIEKQYHDKVFNRFFRIDKSRTVKNSTGLGLAIVKHILENHNSAIYLESKPGKGSTFSFLLSRDKILASASE